MQRAQNLIFAGTNMTVRGAINGFGRIGANVLRAIVEYGRKDVTVAAINGVGGAATTVSLSKCDSGSFRGMIISGVLPNVRHSRRAHQAALGHE